MPLSVWSQYAAQLFLQLRGTFLLDWPGIPAGTWQHGIKHVGNMLAECALSACLGRECQSDSADMITLDFYPLQLAE